MDLRAAFGDLDIYLFDQLLKGRFSPHSILLDAGCGAGRNLAPFLRGGFEVHGIDRNPEALEEARALAATHVVDLPKDRFQVATLEALPQADQSFDAVICCAVLHFAKDPVHFQAMWGELGRVLRPGGLLFVRLASSMGMADRLQPLGESRFRLPDGTERFLVDEAMIEEMVRSLPGTLLDPVKTTLVAGKRAMTTLCLRKSPD
nr:class I SAM-dependent methyltransferase [uncultured Holophaga sp.]